MLYNESTGKPKADVFSLESLIAWLETRPAETVYCLIGSLETCLLGQWVASTISDPARVRDMSWRLGCARPFNEIAGIDTDRVKNPRTFGAALERARALQQ